jgi:TOBE domain.
LDSPTACPAHPMATRPWSSASACRCSPAPPRAIPWPCSCARRTWRWPWPAAAIRTSANAPAWRSFTSLAPWCAWIRSSPPANTSAGTRANSSRPPCSCPPASCRPVWRWAMTWLSPRVRSPRSPA